MVARSRSGNNLHFACVRCRSTVPGWQPAAKSFLISSIWVCGWCFGGSCSSAISAVANASVITHSSWPVIPFLGITTPRHGPETLISNWLSIVALTPSIFFYDFKGGISIGAAQVAIKDCPIPIAAQNRGFLSFAPLHQLQEHFGPNLPLQLADTCDTDTFLDSGWHSQRLAPKDCRPKFTDMSRRALDAYFDAKGLKPFEYADRRNAWWATARHATMDQHAFAWGDLKGRRQLVGRSEKRGFHWHYGVSCSARSGPVLHVRIAARVIFTSN